MIRKYATRRAVRLCGPTLIGVSFKCYGTTPMTLWPAQLRLLVVSQAPLFTTPHCASTNYVFSKFSIIVRHPVFRIPPLVNFSS